MNSVATATGAAAAFLGAIFMLVPRWLFGADDTGAAAIIFIVAVPVAIALLAVGALPAAHARARTTARGRSTARWSTRWPPAGCTVPARCSACRRWPPRCPGWPRTAMVFGINTLLVLVIVRHTDTQAVAGLGTAVLFVAATGIGSVPGHRRAPRRPSAGGAATRTANGALAFAAVIQLAGAGLQLPMMVVCGFLLGAAGQVVKLCADTAMQIDVDDALRGHVFTVQDSLFWMSFIVAIAVAATVIPADGHAPGAGPRRRRRSTWSGWPCTPPSAAARQPPG